MYLIYSMKKSNLLALAFSFFVFVSFAQKSGGLFYQKAGLKNLSKEENEAFETAKEMLDEKLYPFAYNCFKELSIKYPNETYLKYLMAICGTFIGDKHDEALTLFNEVKEKNKKAAYLNYYEAILNHKTYQFDKAIELANLQLKDTKLEPDQIKILNQLIQYCNNAKELVKNPIQASIENAGSPPNTENAEYSPVITTDEETMLFTYRGVESTGGLRDFQNNENKYGCYFEDIFLSKKVDGKWQKAVTIGDNNTNGNDAVIAISNDGEKIFLYRFMESDGGDIYVSNRDGDKFTEAVRLEGEINSGYWEGSMSLSGDHKKIYFASERPGGFGGKDLYSAVKMADGTWGNIKNLGDKVNTPLDDDAPFIHPDGRTLVFSSKGHNSMGDYDIFLSDIDEIDSTWKKPTNIGYPINTPDDDIYYFLSADGKRGYYASAKSGGYGDKDIYMVAPAVSAKKSYLTVLKGKITENLQPYSGEVVVIIKSGNKNFGTFKSNSANGHYLLSLPSGYNYKITFYHKSYGEKVADVITEKLNGYAEKIVDINFGENDTLNKFQTIILESPSEDKPAVTVTTPSPTPANENPVTASTSNVTDIKGMSRDQLFNKFADLKMGGLSFIVQVGAYRHPENYKGEKMKSFGGHKRDGTIMGDVHLIIATKEFSTWREADDFCKKVKSGGTFDAFITASLNGKRMYLKELTEQGVWLNTGM